MSSPSPFISFVIPVYNEEQNIQGVFRDLYASLRPHPEWEWEVIVINDGSSDNTVKITTTGFEPKMLTIKAGTTVTFVNEDANQHWPASAMHPTHTVYPGSDIKKCGSSESIFDACKGLEQGESFSFTFTEKGSWKYHDHLGISSTGTIVVE